MAPRFILMSSTARRAVLALALLGFGASAWSAFIHHRLLTEPGYTSVCDVSATVNCTQVYLSRFGSVAGVPVAIWGALYFLGVLLLLSGAGRRDSAFAENVPGYLFAASTLGLAAVLYLGYASLFILGTVCLLCLATYVAVIGIFGITGGVTSFPMTSLPRRLAGDLGRLTGSPAAMAAAAAFVIASAAAVTLGGGAGAAGVTAPERPAETAASGERVPSEFERWYEEQPRMDVPVPADGADVVVVKFNDYQCPPCRDTYLQYKPILAKYERTHPGRIRFVTKHFPLDPECNAGTPAGQHLAACEAAVAVQLAERQNRSEQMEEYLFRNQATLSPVSVREAAREVGGSGDFEEQYARALDRVKQDIALGQRLGVQATPTFFINGVKVPGGLQPQFFDAALAYELEKAGQ